MATSLEHAKLCCLVVEDVYGPFLSHIFQVLAECGRLAGPQLAQKCRLPLRQLQSGLASLIQLRLVYHHTPSQGITSYQANTTNAYNLIRTGQLIQLAEQSEGHDAARILQQLALLGYSTARELEARILELPPHEEQSDGSTNPKPNGHSDRMSLDNPTTLQKDFKSNLRRLIDNKYICRVRDSHFSSTYDARTEVERELFGGGGNSSTKSKKAQAEADEMVSIRLAQRLDASVSSYDVLNELSSTNLDRRTLLCLDYSNSIIMHRNKALASLAETMLGAQTARVLHASAKQVDLGSRAADSALDNNVSTSLRTVLDVAEIEDEVEHGEEAMMRPLRISQNGRSNARAPNGNHSSFTGNGSHTHINIQDHLAILSESHFSFIQNDLRTGMWSIDHNRMNLFLRDKEMMRIVQDEYVKHGPSLRILRMLSEKGKLDEKSLQEIGLLGAKDLRKTLGYLQSAGLLELQEVPREPQRQPNRTIFLWFYDAERVQKLLLHRLYKSMSRLYQRLHIERQKLSALTSHLEREDVAQDNLAKKQLEELAELRQKESWFASEIGRLDQSVALLRDL
ncbi:hypothetical protein PV10_04135 [Exophiala mesophila]|uniref:DNA-directed RNA polymerase III subunit RPC3 n=1 Tax=Exophiala mesophila TaxID=212818 RepID=A0A0D1XXB2_EXOME|nr:uncharacterized protein PV10_04135 [Exophiala mesophila]KIV92871.1 hypothetical protein PV10_04135 [Exophiala mesophila]